ncbi:hypothetical protein KR054_007489, partial [Drosophila jambulina]
ATEKPKTGKGKAASSSATTAASGKARVAADPPAPPPMNSKKVAKAPAVALKSLEKKVDETEDVTKKVAGKGTKRQAAPPTAATSNVATKKLRSNAPAGAAKDKPGEKVASPKDAAPPTPTKKSRMVIKEKAKILETVKEEVEEEAAAPKAKAAKQQAEKPVAKVQKPMLKPNPMKSKKLQLRGKGAACKKKVWQRFVIDCSCLVEDLLMDLTHLEKYMKTHIKVNKRVNNLGELVNFERPKNTTLVINSNTHFSKRYFKYLTKRYLKKNSLRDWVRLVSTAKDTFTMRYFKIQDDDNDDDDVI